MASLSLVAPPSTSISDQAVPRLDLPMPKLHCSLLKYIHEYLSCIIVLGCLRQVRVMLVSESQEFVTRLAIHSIPAIFCRKLVASARREWQQRTK